MKLTRVTITGADDGVSPAALMHISKVYPFVEWGLLISFSRQGTPRYPRTSWLQTFQGMADGAIAAAGHLCGQSSREVFEGLPPWCPGRGAFQRLQVNGFSSRPPSDFAASLKNWIEHQHEQIILQCTSEGAMGDAEGYFGDLDNVAVLWDRSGGRGLAESGWPPPLSLPTGFAGGISKHNALAAITALKRKESINDEFWIDLESGVRTDDRFDLEKVVQFLQLVEPFVEVSRG